MSLRQRIWQYSLQSCHRHLYVFNEKLIKSDIDTINFYITLKRLYQKTQLVKFKPTKRKLFVNIFIDVNTGLRFQYYYFLFLHKSTGEVPGLLLSVSGHWIVDVPEMKSYFFISVQIHKSLGKYFIWASIDVVICYGESYILERQWKYCGLYSQVRTLIHQVSHREKKRQEVP